MSVGDVKHSGAASTGKDVNGNEIIKNGNGHVGESVKSSLITQLT